MERNDIHLAVSLETVMKTSVLKTMNNPCWPIVYGTVSWKLGCFYERYWCNQAHGLKRNTEKASEMTYMIDRLKSINPTEKGIAVMACYARQIKKFEKTQYEYWKKFIWMDLGVVKKQMEEYVEAVTPPEKKVEESKEEYKKRQKEQFQNSYNTMCKGMILVQILNKIWTLRKAKKETEQSFQKTQKKTKQMLKVLQSKNEKIKAQMQECLGDQEWNEIANLW